jgi:glucokinase
MKEKFAIGVDLGGTNIKCGIVNQDGKIIKKVSVETRASQGTEIILSQIKKAIELVLRENDKNIKGIGLGAPGIVKPEKGTVEYPPNLKGWGIVPLKKILEKEFKIPAYLENDANAAAIGELVFGSGKTLSNFILITLGTGVGGGIIYNGEIYRGPFGGAGEIGHISIDYKGRKCNCGSRGCIEAYWGNAQLVDRAKRSLRYHPNSLLKRIIKENNGVLTPLLINEAIKKGDEFATEFVKRSGRLLGFALASVVNILDIPDIIIGGGVAGFGRILFDSVEEGIKERVLKSQKERIKVRKAKLKNDAGTKGAAALVFHNK